MWASRYLIIVTCFNNLSKLKQKSKKVVNLDKSAFKQVSISELAKKIRKYIAKLEEETTAIFLAHPVHNYFKKATTGQSYYTASQKLNLSDKSSFLMTDSSQRPLPGY